MKKVHVIHIAKAYYHVLLYLRRKRDKLGLSRKEFAALFEMDVDTYRKYEEGTRNPRDNAFRMMKKLI
jgi:DNA-binding transcriptional regulator YiaG